MSWAAAVHEHQQGVAALRESLTATVAALRKDMDFSRRELHHLAEILVDDALLFRFFKKHKYNQENAEQAFLEHIDWRLQNDLPNLSTGSFTPKAHQLSQDGLFYFWKTDLEGRPVAVLNLKHLSKATDLEDLRMLFVVQMEVARRLVQSINEENQRCGSDKLVVQISVICDLNGVGLGNVNYEMIPLFLDLFNRHFPQTLGTVYVLNYGWLHSGIWSIVKAALPADACRKLQFFTKAELLRAIDGDNLQVMHGGNDTATFSLATSPVYTRFAHPNYHSTSRRVQNQISVLDAEDEGYHEDEEVWYDALETPMTPVRSAADLQSMLRVASGRNLHGMNRVGSTKSLKSLARPMPGALSTGGLMMRQLQQPPLPPTTITAAPPLPTSARIPGRRRAFVKKTLVRAVQKPAQPLLSLLSHMSPLTVRKRSITMLLLCAMALLYSAWKRNGLGRLYLNWILRSSPGGSIASSSTVSSSTTSAKSCAREYGMKKVTKFAQHHTRDVGTVIDPMVVAAIGGALGI
ncbi:hypothetical protein PhCBS80983_g00104 [Powellomyces hirtus]|uniref:CRAL-TRIO domain-containing protein n=1 Tax=Powellomyces hirtus TaxID=109895 RepID=A0A507EHT3_9FUNG|nr:hypothetical protein PhCBS80983_g00104 [Powellomyces hirtus]